MLAASLSLVLACSSTVARAQDPEVRGIDAVRRGDVVAAAQAAAGLASPAARARWQAALLPLAQRPAALLEAAIAHAGDPAADEALVAAVGATLLVLRREELVPELAAWNEHEADIDPRDGGYVDFTDISSTVVRLRGAVAARLQENGSAPLREAQRWLELACVSRFGFVPAHVAARSPWRLPEGTGSLQVRAFRVPPGRLDWRQMQALPEPAWQHTLQPGAVLPPLAAGDWLLDVQSPGAPWRGLRAVTVTETAVVGFADADVVALAAFGPDGPTAATWRGLGRWAAGGGDIGREGGVLQLPGRCEFGEGPAADSLHLTTAFGTASLELPRPHTLATPSTRWLVHAMVDRPLFRPGETLHGRLVVRRCTWQGEGVEAVPSTQSAADQELELEFATGTAAAKRLRGRTDALGVFPFQFELPATLEPGTRLASAVHLPGAVGREPHTLWLGNLGDVAYFRRAAVHVAANGPRELAAAAEHADVTLQAQWAAGGPAAALVVRAEVVAWQPGDDWRREVRDLRTDANGRAVVRIHGAHVRGHGVRVDFVVVGPDGQQLEASHVLEGPPRSAPADSHEPGASGIAALELGTAIVGQTCPVQCRGEPGLRALLVVGRGRAARTHVLQLDAAGRAQASVPVLAADWPDLDVALATVRGQQTLRVPVLLRPAPGVAIDVPERARPGDEIVCRIATGIARTAVTVGIVDERIFAIAPDRTAPPNDALAPTAPWPSWARVATPPQSAPADVLASLLEEGRVPPLDGSLDLSRQRWPGAGGPAAGGAGVEGLRADFRATAAFVTAVADADGVAVVRCTLPHDLTQWRVTVVGVAPDGQGFVERRSLAARQPLAIEPLLPRAVRAGDAFELPLQIDRGVDAGAALGTAVRLHVAAIGDALQVASPPDAVAVAPGAVGSTAVALRALQAGSAQLALDAELGDLADRARHTVVVGRDAVVRPLQAAAFGSGEVQVPLPDGADAAGEIVVEVVEGTAAMWRTLVEDLEVYPYGCAEQTLSRLLPYFAALRAAQLRGAPLPAMDAAFRQRLQAGLARLRALQRGRGEGFAFWPGEPSEPRITALVLHGLAVLRAAGHDPAAAGITFAPRGAMATAAIEQVSRAPIGIDAEFLAAAELVAGALRFVPTDGPLREAALRLAARAPELPKGLLRRLGLALHGVGEPDAARRCREAAGVPAATGGGRAFFGEDALAVQALTLELDGALGVAVARRDAAVAELLLACLRGDGSTYAQACALTAIAAAVPLQAAAASAADVDVQVGGERRRFPLGGPQQQRVRWRVPGAGAVQVRAEAGRQLLVRVRAERSERAGDHAAWQAPLRVERWFARVGGSLGTALVPIAQPLPIGEPLVLCVRVQAPSAQQHVVVDCPLPAGCELAADVDGIDRFDDRIAFAWDLQPGVWRERRIPVVLTVAGRLLMPPTCAMAMYDTGCEGGSAGEFLVVAHAATAAPTAATRVECFTDPRPEPLGADPVVDAIQVFAGAVRAAWQDRRAAGGGEAAFTAALAAAPRREAVQRPFAWFERLTELCAECEAPVAPVAPAEAWREAAAAVLRQWQQQATVSLLQGWDAAVSGESRGGDVLERVVAGADGWADAVAREQVLAAGIRIARERSPIGCARIVERIGERRAVTSPLRGELFACLRDDSASLREAAFLALPIEDALWLPPSAVLAIGTGDLVRGAVTLLLASEPGRSELQQRLRDPEFVCRNLPRLGEEVPAAVWATVPWTVFAAVAEVDFTAMAAELAGIDLFAHVANGPFANADLQQTMAATAVAPWRLLLARALRARGVRSAGDAPSDCALWPLWQRAMALAEDDAAAATRLLRDVAAASTGVLGSSEGDALVAFVLPVLVAAGTPSEVLPYAADIDAAGWATIWHRLLPHERIELIDGWQDDLCEAFVPDTAMEAEALWRYQLRVGEAWAVTAALSGSPAGRRLLVDRLTDPTYRDDSGLRELAAEELGYDVVTGVVDIDTPWLPALRRLVRHGAGGAWAPAQRMHADRLLRLRGLGPLPRRE